MELHQCYQRAGRQFAELMTDYREATQRPEFDVQKHLMELYHDLCHLHDQMPTTDNVEKDVVSAMKRNLAFCGYKDKMFEWDYDEQDRLVFMMHGFNGDQAAMVHSCLTHFTKYPVKTEMQRDDKGCNLICPTYIAVTFVR